MVISRMNKVNCLIATNTSKSIYHIEDKIVQCCATSNILAEQREALKCLHWHTPALQQYLWLYLIFLYFHIRDSLQGTQVLVFPLSTKT